MKKVSSFNPLKNNIDFKHVELISNLIQQVNGKVCFVGDEVGYFFSPVRRVKHPSISFTNRFCYSFFYSLKEDGAKMKKIFKMYHSLFDYKLVEHFESRIFIENDPMVQSYLLLCLCNLSKNIDCSFSEYSEQRVFTIEESISKLGQFFIGNNNLYYNEIPEHHFLISFEKEIDREGVLITKKKRDFNSIGKINNLNYYYVEAK